MTERAWGNWEDCGVQECREGLECRGHQGWQQGECTHAVATLPEGDEGLTALCKSLLTIFKHRVC